MLISALEIATMSLIGAYTAEAKKPTEKRRQNCCPVL